jgi:hypothetical protein
MQLSPYSPKPYLNFKMNSKIRVQLHGYGSGLVRAEQDKPVYALNEFGLMKVDKETDRDIH